MKGPEAAARYPEPGVRPFCDLDFLADDPDAAHRALMASGFVEMGDPARYEDAHHLRPLALPEVPIVIELHREPNHPAWLTAPDTSELLQMTRPSATEVAGLSAPVPVAHAVLLAAHSWAHAPLRRLLDLIDVMVVLESDADRRLARELASRWGLGRVWRTTITAADALFGCSASMPALRIWARHLAAVRERTVFETHLTRWAGPVCGLPYTPMRALGGATRIFTDAARPREDERWTDAVRRTRLAIVVAPRPQSERDRIKEARNAGHRRGDVRVTGSEVVVLSQLGRQLQPRRQPKLPRTHRRPHRQSRRPQQLPARRHRRQPAHQPTRHQRLPTQARNAPRSGRWRADISEADLNIGPEKQLGCPTRGVAENGCRARSGRYSPRTCWRSDDVQRRSGSSPGGSNAACVVRLGALLVFRDSWLGRDGHAEPTCRSGRGLRTPDRGSTPRHPATASPCVPNSGGGQDKPRADGR